MSSILLRDFLHQVIICSEKAACIARLIRFMQTDFDKVIEEKKPIQKNGKHFAADYKTLADVIIQEVIKRDLLEHYPSLADRIYGEEDGSLKINSNDEKVMINVSGTLDETVTLLEKLFNSKDSKSIQNLAKTVHRTGQISIPDDYLPSFNQIPSDIHIDLANVGVWIDPVDGTQQYINGTDGKTDPETGIFLDGLPTAMVLIGCFDTNNGQAILGVINKAFNQRSNDENKWEGLIYWGTALADVRYNNLSDVHKSTRSNNRRTLLYGSVNIETFNNLFHDWNKLDVAACGELIRKSNKLLSIGLKQADVYVLTKSSAYNWDLCAAHAILRSINGQIIDLNETLDFYRKNQNIITDIDWSQFQLVYNNIKTLKFKPSECAVKPFIAYHSSQDLIDVLQVLLVNSNTFSISHLP